jgi:MFS family permease
MTHSHRKAWVVVLTSALFFFYAFINMNLFNSLHGPISETFHMNPLQVSYLAATYFYANVIFLIPAGLLLDRFSPRKLMLTTLMVMVLSIIAFAATDNVMVAFACRFILGICSCFCLLGSVLLASRWFPANMMGKAVGFVVTLAMLGGMTAQAMEWLSEQVHTWQHAFFIIGALGGIIWILMWLWVSDMPAGTEEHYQHLDHERQGIGFWPSLGKSLTNPHNWIAGLYTNILNIPVVVLGGLWALSYLEVKHHMSMEQAATISSMIFLGMIIGSPFFGWVSDKLQRRRTPMLIAGLLLLITIIIIMADPTLTYWPLLVLFLMLGFFAGAQIISYALVIEVNPPYITGTSESLASVLIMASGAIFQPLFGFLLEFFSAPGTTEHFDSSAYQHAMMLLPITFVIAIVLALIVKETRCRNLFKAKPV